MLLLQVSKVLIDVGGDEIHINRQAMKNEPNAFGTHGYNVQSFKYIQLYQRSYFQDRRRVYNIDIILKNYRTFSEVLI